MRRKRRKIFGEGKNYFLEEKKKENIFWREKKQFFWRRNKTEKEGKGGNIYLKKETIFREREQNGEGK